MDVETFKNLIGVDNVNSFFALITLVLLASRVAMAGAEGEKATLAKLEHEWNEALKSRNASWFEEHLADDFTDISSGNGAQHTKAENISALKTDTTKYETLELSNLQVRIEGNAGVVTGVNHISGHDDQGQSFEVRLAFTDTYIKRGGYWLVWASQHTRMK